MKKILLFLLKSIGLILKKSGRGSTLVGYLDIKFNLNIARNINLENKNVIFVIGTNGKTTTANLLSNILANESTVINNIEGANLLSGLLTTLIMNTNYDFTIDADNIVLEVDEKTVKNALSYFKPNHVVITNFFRDQLDRYGEIDTIIDEIIKSLATTDATIHLNGNDPLMVYRFEKVPNKQIFFGLGENKLSTKTQNKIVELKYCPHCLQVLNYNFYHYAHIGNYECEHCDFKQSVLNYNLNVDYENQALVINDFTLPLAVENFPPYFYFNIISAICVLDTINCDWQKHLHIINTFAFPKGRNKHFSANGKNVYFNLAKNVVGMEESLDYINKYFTGNIDLIIAFNDNFADGTDVSWIWDANMHTITNRLNTLHIVGTRKNDMALRFGYEDFENIVIYDDIYNGVTTALNKAGNNVAIISNYTPLVTVDKAIKDWSKHEN